MTTSLSSRIAGTGRSDTKTIRGRVEDYKKTLSPLMPVDDGRNKLESVTDVAVYAETERWEELMGQWFYDSLDLIIEECGGSVTRLSACAELSKRLHESVREELTERLTTTSDNIVTRILSD